MKNNVNDEKSFRDRIADYQLQRRIVTQSELKDISKQFKKQNNLYLKDMDKEINIEEVLYRCRENTPKGERYILTPKDESGSNPANIIPLEEMALMELFKAGDSYNNEVVVLLNNERVKIEWNNRNYKNKVETIEISFGNMQDKNLMQNEFENQL